MKKRAKTTKRKTTKRKTTQESVFTIASRIRKPGEDWQKAIQRAKKLR